MGYCKLDSKLFLQEPQLLNKQKTMIYQAVIVSTDLEYSTNRACKTQNNFQKQPTTKRQIYRFSGFPQNSYLTESKIQEIHPTKSSFSSAYLHEVAEGMDINVYYGDHGRGRKKNPKKQERKECYMQVLKKQKNKNFLKTEIKDYAFITFLLLV